MRDRLLDGIIREGARQQSTEVGHCSKKVEVLETWLWAVQDKKLGPPLVRHFQDQFLNVLSLASLVR